MNREQQKKWIRSEVGGGGEGFSVEKSQSHNFCLFLLTFNRKPKILNEHHLIYYTINFFKKSKFPSHSL